MLSAIDRLRLFLRPPGRGIATFSTGGGYAKNLLKALYGTDQPEQVHEAWEETLSRIRRVEAVIFGIPSDTGAGILRGANFGPIGVREAYLSRYHGYPKTLIDLGDVICIPQLLHDEMLCEPQKEACRKHLYPGEESQGLPVSPLSISESVVKTVFELNPEVRVLSIGGDHSVSWPMVAAFKERYQSEFGILHFDAHSDLMSSRLGVNYCFATWAFHAQRILKPRALVQVGLRVSSRTREEWESSLPVRQIWAREVKGNEEKVIQMIVDHFTKMGIKAIYISNDIDGTDSEKAPATGTPEALGLQPEFIRALIQKVGKSFKVLGGDIVEVAPPLSGSLRYKEEPTCLLAADYLHDLITATSK